MATGFSGNFSPGIGNAVPSSQVEISVECRNLVDMDVFSKSDPMVVLFTWEVAMGTWKEFGRTEIIWDNLNPVFIKKFVMDYFFEESQKLKFEVYDVDSKSRDLSKHDFLGMTECTLGEIVSSARLQKALRGPKVNSGSIIFTAEELSSCKEEASMQLCGHKLDKKDFFGKSDPFLTFYRSNEDGSFTAVHKTEVIKTTLNPVWKPFTAQVRTLCNGDHDRSMKIECYDWNQSGSHSLIGGFITSLRELERGPGPQNTYELIHREKKAKKKKYKNSGMVELLSIKVISVPSFLDFVKGGMQIHCTISIDFTASNGNPSSPTSLHYVNPYQPNQYATALKAVGEIIQDYDSTKMFPALGFGARLPPDGTVSHEFILNGNPSNPYCHGIEGVLQAYHQALRTVQLYGPTNFAPTINHVARFAAASRSGTDYYILLIITDGVITDMPQTKEAIVNASMLPLSIIIVGVGDAEFDAMDELDGDDVRLSSRGRVAARDIVQFVPFREFLGRGSMAVSQARLAKEVLAEVPDQVISYMRANNIKPRPPLQRQATFPTAPRS